MELIEALRPFLGPDEVKARSALLELRARHVTAAVLKTQEMGKRVKALEKSQNAQISRLAKEVVSAWKSQLLH